MIDINLLPESMRKKERMPLPQFLALCLAVVIMGGLVTAIAKYRFDTIPTLERKERDLRQEVRNLQVQAEELKRLNAEIARMSEYVETVKSLYKNRKVWSKLLADIKSIVNFDATMSEYNTDMRYIWFTTLAGDSRKIDLGGFSTAGTQNAAMQMTEQLLQGFLTYAPPELPEKQEEIKLEQQLRSAIAEHDIARRENPDLPIQGPQEVMLRQKLDSIRNMRSGEMALQPFSSFLIPGSLKLLSVSWGAAPRPQRRTEGLTEVFPDMAWSFRLTMNLK